MLLFKVSLQELDTRKIHSPMFQHVHSPKNVTTTCFNRAVEGV